MTRKKMTILGIQEKKTAGPADHHGHGLRLPVRARRRSRRDWTPSSSATRSAWSCSATTRPCP